MLEEVAELLDHQPELVVLVVTVGEGPAVLLLFPQEIPLE
jgi:hypothetical protein